MRGALQSRAAHSRWFSSGRVFRPLHRFRPRLTPDVAHLSRAIMCALRSTFPPSTR